MIGSLILMLAGLVIFLLLFNAWRIQGWFANRRHRHSRESS